MSDELMTPEAEEAAFAPMTARIRTLEAEIVELKTALVEKDAPHEDCCPLGQDGDPDIRRYHACDTRDVNVDFRVMRAMPNPHPDASPVPTPARVLLPAPDGLGGSTAWWRLSGGLVYASPGGIYHAGETDLDAIEADALAALAAVRWAKRGTP